MGQTSEPAAAIIGERPGLADRGISVGDRVEVLDVQPFDGPIRARIGNAIHVLGSRLAQAMRVEIGV